MLTSESISSNANAPVVVLFGGNPYRRDEVIKHIKQLGDISIYGTLGEKEGLQKIISLPKVDVILIGGKYTNEQRLRIRSFVGKNLPNTKISEPGFEYPYENEAINNDLKKKLNI